VRRSGYVTHAAHSAYVTLNVRVRMPRSYPWGLTIAAWLLAAVAGARYGLRHPRP
jgi:hypothetical protein